MATIKPIEIKGLKEAVRDAKKVDRELPKEFRKALNEGADLIVTWAAPKVPKRSGKAASSIKAASTQKTARVRAGGSRAPYYPWLDFGGRVGPNNSVERKYYSDGRYIYPAFTAQRPQIEETLLDALVRKVNESSVFNTQ